MKLINFLAVVIDNKTTNIMSIVLMGLIIFILILLGFYLFYPKGRK